MRKIQNVLLRHQGPLDGSTEPCPGKPRETTITNANQTTEHRLGLGRLAVHHSTIATTGTALNGEMPHRCPHPQSTIRLRWNLALKFHLAKWVVGILPIRAAGVFRAAKTLMLISVMGVECIDRAPLNPPLRTWSLLYATFLPQLRAQETIIYQCLA